MSNRFDRNRGSCAMPWDRKESARFRRNSILQRLVGAYIKFRNLASEFEHAGGPPRALFFCRFDRPNRRRGDLVPVPHSAPRALAVRGATNLSGRGTPEPQFAHGRTGPDVVRGPHRSFAGSRFDLGRLDMRLSRIESRRISPYCLFRRESSGRRSRLKPHGARRRRQNSP